MLFTQKLIGKPYLKADVVLQDESRYASKTGLSSLQAGFQTRYEINKKVMPFVDFGYGYEKGLKQTAWQTGTDSEHGWYYGAGLTLKFNCRTKSKLNDMPLVYTDGIVFLCQLWCKDGFRKTRESNKCK